MRTLERNDQAPHAQPRLRGPRSVRRRAAGVIAFVFALSGANCGGGGVDKQAYVAANQRVLRAVPVFANARVLDTTTAPYYEEGTSGAQGYTTNIRYRVPAGASFSDVSAFYRRRLAAHWKLTEVLPGNARDGPVLNFCRNKAFVSVNLQSKKQHVLEIDVDYDSYGKSGRPPRCAR